MSFKRWSSLGILILSHVVPANQKPNILVILMDDFGTGHFAPVARQLELDEVDSDFRAYTAELGETYDQQAAPKHPAVLCRLWKRWPRRGWFLPAPFLQAVFVLRPAKGY